jgi:hypothetical protein
MDQRENMASNKSFIFASLSVAVEMFTSLLLSNTHLFFSHCCGFQLTHQNIIILGMWTGLVWFRIRTGGELL